MQFELHIQRQMESRAPTPGAPGRADRATFQLLGRDGGRALNLAQPGSAWPVYLPTWGDTGARRESTQAGVGGAEGREPRREKDIDRHREEKTQERGKGKGGEIKIKMRQGKRRIQREERWTDRQKTTNRNQWPLTPGTV